MEVKSHPSNPFSDSHSELGMGSINSYRSQASELNEKNKNSCIYLQDKVEGRCSTVCQKIQAGTEPPTCLFSISKLPWSLISSYLKSSFEEHALIFCLLWKGVKSSEKQFKSMCILQWIVVHNRVLHSSLPCHGNM